MDQDKKKYSLCNLIKSTKSYIKMVISYDLLLAKMGYLMGIILKKSEIFECKVSITNNEMFKKDGTAKIQEFCQERDQLVESAMFCFDILLLPEVHSEWTSII